MSGKVTWARHGKGYEVSTKGDMRFSAFFAKLEDGRSIEQHFQGDIKGYDPGGTNWRLGKGKPPKDKSIDLWGEYLKLWRRWADLNPHLLEELYHITKLTNNLLTDRFANSDCNQARALAFLINEKYYSN